jgi:hypothetical protein
VIVESIARADSWLTASVRAAQNEMRTDSRTMPGGSGFSIKVIDATTADRTIKGHSSR